MIECLHPLGGIRFYLMGGVWVILRFLKNLISAPNCVPYMFPTRFLITSHFIPLFCTRSHNLITYQGGQVGSTSILLFWGVTSFQQLFLDGPIKVAPCGKKQHLTQLNNRTNKRHLNIIGTK
jgi:hypothetical protein